MALASCLSKPLQHLSEILVGGHEARILVQQFAEEGLASQHFTNSKLQPNLPTYAPLRIHLLLLAKLPELL